MLADEGEGGVGWPGTNGSEDRASRGHRKERERGCPAGLIRQGRPDVASGWGLCHRDPDTLTVMPPHLE
jgi:hypothetical protein